MKKSFLPIVFAVFSLTLIFSCTHEELDFNDYKNSIKESDSLQIVKETIKDTVSNIDPIEPEGR